MAGVTLRALPDPDPERDLVILGSGVVSRLHDELYARLPHGRLVILGAPGAGKTGSMILLLLAALDHRDSVDEAERMDVPVPVWLTLGGWNPAVTSLAEWARSVLVRDHPYLPASSYGHDAAGELLNGGHLALFLDGLDEMPPAVRGSALDRLDKESLGLRIVLTSRRNEFLQALADGHLHSAAVIEVRPVRAREAADYLVRDQVGDQAAGWREVGAYLKAHPDSVVAATLDNPLTLSLARSAFQHTDPTAMTDPERFPTTAALREHLLDRALVNAYPDDRQRAYAVKWLSWIAHRMGTDRDLSWWHIPRWIPRWEHMYRTVSATTIAGVLSIGLGLLVHFGLLHRGGTSSDPVLFAGYLLQISLVGGLAALGGSMLVARRGSGGYAEPGRLHPRLPLSSEFAGLARVVAAASIGIGLTVGLATELGPLLWSAVDRAITDGLAAQVLAGSDLEAAFDSVLVVGLGVGIPAGLVFGLHRLWSVPVEQVAAATPNSTLVDDRRTSVWMSLVAGLLVGLGSGLLVGIAVDPYGGLFYGVVIGVWVGLVGRLVFGVRSTLAYTERRLARRFGRPRPRFARLLDDALQRQVLRQAGSVYQFRHADVQDDLARRYQALHGVKPIAPAALSRPPNSLLPTSRGSRALAASIAAALLATVLVVVIPAVNSMIRPDHTTLIGTRIRTFDSNVALSPDGRLLARGDKGWTELWDLSERRVIHTLQGSIVGDHYLLGNASLAFSADGTTLATYFGSTVGWWDVSTGRSTRTMSVTPNANSVVFSPNRNYVVTVDPYPDSTLRLWNVGDGSTRELPSWPVFSPDENTLAIAGNDYRDGVRLQDVATGRNIRTITGAESPLAFSPDGRLLATSSNDSVELWNVDAGVLTATFPVPGESGFTDAKFSPEGKILVTSFRGREEVGIIEGESGAHQLWDLPTGTLITTLGFGEDMTAAPVFSPDGATLATVWFRDSKSNTSQRFSDYRVRLWNVASGTISRSLAAGGHELLSLAFSPDGKTLATGWSDDRVRIWEVSSAPPR